MKKVLLSLSAILVSLIAMATPSGDFIRSIAEVFSAEVTEIDGETLSMLMQMSPELKELGQLGDIQLLRNVSFACENEEQTAELMELIMNTEIDNYTFAGEEKGRYMWVWGDESTVNGLLTVEVEGNNVEITELQGAVSIDILSKM